MTEPHPSNGPECIHRPIGFLVDPLKRFMLIEAADGGILLLAALVALVVANSPLGGLSRFLAERFWICCR